MKGQSKGGPGGQRPGLTLASDIGQANREPCQLLLASPPARSGSRPETVLGNRVFANAEHVGPLSLEASGQLNRFTPGMCWSAYMDQMVRDKEDQLRNL